MKARARKGTGPRAVGGWVDVILIHDSVVAHHQVGFVFGFKYAMHSVKVRCYVTGCGKAPYSFEDRVCV